LTGKWEALPKPQKDTIGGFIIGFIVGLVVRAVLVLVPTEEFHEIIHGSYLFLSMGILFLAIMIAIYNVFKKEALYAEFWDSFILGFVTAFEIIGIIRSLSQGELPLP